MITLPHVAGRIFGQPLAIEPYKLDVIVSAIGPRLRGQDLALWDDDDDDDDDSDSPSVVDGIAVINIYGTLVCKTSGMAALSGMTSYAGLAAQFAAALADPSVSGILLSIDSPGGEVAGMFALADAIYNARGTKPVCAFVECAASAAYALASAADQIVVSRTALTGSIGVIALHMDQSGADEKEGLKYTAIYAGARKNDGNPHAPLSAEAKDGIQGRIDTIYGMFTAAVARNRAMADSAVRDTQAAVYMGQAGVNAGLADAVGESADAIHSIRSAQQAGQKSIYAVMAVPANPKPTGERRMETQTAEQIEAAKTAAVAAGVLAAQTESATITDLCMLAGMPERASEYLAAKKTSAEVRTDLMKVKAAAQLKVDEKLNPGVQPGADAALGALAPKPEGVAKPWSDVMGAIQGREK